MYNLSDSLTHLSKICDIIHSTTGLDIALWDANFNQLVFLSRTQYSFLSHSVYESYLQEMKEHLGHLSCSSSYLHPLSEPCFLYYDIRIQLSEDLVFYACVGPVLSELYSEELVLSIIHKFKISPDKREHFTLFYRSIPHLSKQISNAFWLSYHLLTTLPDTSNIPNLIFNTDSSESTFNHHLLNTSSFISHSEIQLNYMNEVKWRNAISRGDLKAAQKAHAQLSGNNFFYRTPNNPLRTLKNILFSLNTLSRAAAIDGGADAIEVHKIHELYVIRIENTTTVLEARKIINKIFPSYCKLVIASHTKNLSPIVAKAINYLYAHYDTPLTLGVVANKIHCSEGHLSRIFQKETGKTLGNYLNELRITQAISLMGLNPESISNIALTVGFSSYNKFSIEFKKYTGKSATQYIKDLKEQTIT